MQGKPTSYEHKQEHHDHSVPETILGTELNDETSAVACTDFAFRTVAVEVSPEMGPTTRMLEQISEDGTPEVGSSSKKQQLVEVDKLKLVSSRRDVVRAGEEVGPVEYTSYDPTNSRRLEQSSNNENNIDTLIPSPQQASKVDAMKTRRVVPTCIGSNHSKEVMGTSCSLIEEHERVTGNTDEVSDKLVHVDSSAAGGKALLHGDRISEGGGAEAHVLSYWRQQDNTSGDDVQVVEKSVNSGEIVLEDSDGMSARGFPPLETVIEGAEKARIDQVSPSVTATISSSNDALTPVVEAKAVVHSKTRSVDDKPDLCSQVDPVSLEEASHSSSDEDTGEEDDDEEESEDSYHTSEVSLKEEEIEEFMQQLVEVESEAAQVQESLEDESLLRVREEVATELAETLPEDKLESAVEEEMTTYIELCEDMLEKIEERSALLQEKLEDAGVSLTHLFKWIEKQTPEGCTTEAWKKRTLWVGHQASEEVVAVLNNASEELKLRHPMRSHRGKILDEGASGFLERKLAVEGEDTAAEGTSNLKLSDDDGWSKIEEFLDNDESTGPGQLMGTKRWAAVYLASTPDQAAQLGLTLPGVDIVEEIGDIETEKRAIFKAALKNERERALAEGQEKSIKKVREEDDVKTIRRRQRRSRQKSLKSKQGNAALASSVDVQEEPPGRGLSEDTCHTPTNAVCVNGVESSLLISETALQLSIASGATAVSEKSRPKWKLEGLPDVIDLLSDDDSDTGNLEGAGNQEAASAIEPAESECAPQENLNAAVTVKIEPSGNEALLQGLYTNEDARSGHIHESANAVGDPDVPAIEWKAGFTVEGEFHGSSHSSQFLAEQGLSKKRNAVEGSENAEEFSPKKLRTGQVPEEKVSSPNGSKLEIKQPVPIDMSNKNYLVRTTVVIDSDGEREVEEALTDPHASSESPNGQVTSSVKEGGCTVKSECLVHEDDTISLSDGVLVLQELQRAEPLQRQLNARKRKARLESDMRVNCTSCGIVMKVYDVLRHPNPKLVVAVCRTCTKHYLSGPFRKDEDGSDSECSWCGEGGEVICCTRCDKVFCKSCISRNFGAKESLRVVTDDYWLCFICNDRPLAHLTRELMKAEVELERLLAGDRQVGNVDDSIKEEEGFLRHPKRGKHRKNIRKMLSDDELEEKQKELLAREKERQERLERWQSVCCKPPHQLLASTVASESETQNVLAEYENSPKVTIVGLPINAVRDPDEEPIFMAPNFVKVLKPHQIEGVRFMWENCMESVKKVKSNPDGVGCILAHSMGLGKTLQVITFLHTVLTSDLLWFQTALIVVPVNVLHNWRREFEMWQESLSNPVSVYILDDSIRDNWRRAQLLSSWHKGGGVMIIGYSVFRNLSIGKHVRDKATRDSLCESLQNPGPDILVCDEAHMIKNAKADITQVLRHVRSKRRVALTGSPLQNNLMEYYCMVDFVREGFLGTPAVFKNRFQNPIENGQHCDSTAQDVKVMKICAHVLHKTLKGFVQRMDSSVLKDDLPPKVVYVISVRLSKLQRRLYESYLQIQGIMHNDDEAAENKTHRRLLFNSFHTLSKIWNHPDLLFLAEQEKIRKQQEDSLDEFGYESDEDKLSEPEVRVSTTFTAEGKYKAGNGNRPFKRKGSNDPDELENPLWWKDIMEGSNREDMTLSGKMVLLLELLSMSAARGDKTLVFSQSLGTLDLIEKFMETTLFIPSEGRFWEQDRHWYRLDGSTPAGARLSMCEKFNNPDNTDVKCALISTRAGSLGINLPAANRVIIVDGSWNPVHDLQALFRAWRLGQKKPVFAYRFLACGTMEEKIYNRQVAKEGVAARVLDKNYPERIFNGNDLEFLFRLEPDGDDYVSRESDGPLLVPDKIQAEHASTSAGGFVPMESASKNKLSSFHVPDDAPPVDEVMGKLLLDHRPRWVVRYHEHEALLEHQEKEGLSAEERQSGWETIVNSVQTIQSFPTPIPVTALTLPYIPARRMDELPIVHSVPSSSSRPVCSSKDHAAVLNSFKVEVNSQILCNSCHQLISWNDISTGHKQSYRG